MDRSSLFGRLLNFGCAGWKSAGTHRQSAGTMRVATWLGGPTAAAKASEKCCDTKSDRDVSFTQPTVFAIAAISVDSGESYRKCQVGCAPTMLSIGDPARLAL